MGCFASRSIALLHILLGFRFRVLGWNDVVSSFSLGECSVLFPVLLQCRGDFQNTSALKTSVKNKKTSLLLLFSWISMAYFFCSIKVTFVSDQCHGSWSQQTLQRKSQAWCFNQLDILGLLLSIDRHPVTVLDTSFILSKFLPVSPIAHSTNIQVFQYTVSPSIKDYASSKAQA